MSIAAANFAAPPNAAMTSSNEFMVGHDTIRIAPGQDASYRDFCHASGMEEPHDRLRKARANAGYMTAADAARAFGWNEPSYRSHENGTRGLTPDTAERYARRLSVPVEWLLYGGDDSTPKPRPEIREVPIVGYVSAGATAHVQEGSVLGEVEAPSDATPHTVAVEIRGESLGPFFDRWLVFYDDVRRPVTPDLVGALCVVGLEDGRVMIKKLQRSRARGLFHLLSQAEEPILDVAVEWAAKVKQMKPR